MNDNKKPKIIALTGARKSGKTTVSQRWVEMFNIPVFDADIAFKFVINFDEEIRDKIRSYFGEVSFVSHYLNSAFFDSDKKMKRLLEISEERVFETFFKWRNKQNVEYVLFKCSVVHEFMNLSNFSSIVNVYAPKEVREERIHNMEEDIDLNGELSEIERSEKSNYVIHNYNNMKIHRQINTIHKSILNNS